MFALPIPTNGRLARLSGICVSALIILGFIAAGWSVFPHAAVGDLVRYYRDPLAASWRGTMPVFVMRPDHSVIRHGTAFAGGDGRIRIELFGSTAREHVEADTALLMDSSFGVLWAAATDNSQAELRRRIETVQDELAASVERIITSNVFNSEYRPALRAMLTDAVSYAWRDPRTQAALERLLANAEPALRRALRGEVQEILLSRVKDAMWDMLRANWQNALVAPFGYDLNYEPVMRAVSTTLSDPRIQTVMMGFGRDQLETPEARQLAERLAVGSIDALMRDRRVPGVITQMFWDVRLRTLLRPFTQSILQLLGSLPQHLGGLGAQSSLNPLAAHVFQSFALGARTPLVMLLTPKDLNRIQRIDGDGVVPLVLLSTGSRP
ncbi:hypothetical protein ABLE91_18050 [Aquabacter sp. CN5-332]|uniref:hypothetical protein n=1 Tax=Aquabacter sp. CN5-332 TaxID=3156608 RepID=UPI0032B34DFE